MLQHSLKLCICLRLVDVGADIMSSVTYYPPAGVVLRAANHKYQ